MDYMAKAFLIFFIYSIMGWICEVIYCSIPAKKFVNRGFLIGPYCPVYGVGAATVTITLTPFSNKPILVYFLAVLITSSIEYVAGYYLESVYHLKWWDYSDYKFNIHGRVVLHNSLIFGALSIFAIYVVNPVIINKINMLDFREGLILSIVAFGIFLADNIISTSKVLKLNSSLLKLHLISAEMKEKVREQILLRAKTISSEAESFRIRALAERIDTLSKRVEDISNQNRELVKSVLKAFPSISSRIYPEALSDLKDFIRSNTQKRKNSK